MPSVPSQTGGLALVECVRLFILIQLSGKVVLPMYTHPCSTRRLPLFILGITAALTIVLALPSFVAAQTVKKQCTTQTKKISQTGNTTQTSTATQASDKEPVSIDVLEGIRTGKIGATASGKGDGRITLSLTNKTNTSAPRRPAARPDRLRRHRPVAAAWAAWAVAWAAWAVAWAAAWAVAWAAAWVAWAVAWAVA